MLQMLYVLFGVGTAQGLGRTAYMALVSADWHTNLVTIGCASAMLR